jgi:septal ring factor EnvC (AmiA/AmiB activator)
VGSSGGQERAGLYFEIRHQGKPTNPTKWCTG